MMGRRQLSLRLARRARTRAFLPFLEQVEDRVVLSTFVVTNTGDNLGVNPAPSPARATLRQAIVDSNASAQATSEIDFDIPASTAPNLDVPVPGFDPVNQTWTITLDSPLPAITKSSHDRRILPGRVGIPYRYPLRVSPSLLKPILIQSSPNTTAASTANNAEARVIIDGSQTGGATGFVLDASHSTLRGLIIDGFGVGVSVPHLDASGNPNVGDLIQGNFIGNYFIYPVDPNTGQALPSPNNVAVAGLGNSLQGVLLDSNNTTVGGTNPQENNVIAGNGQAGTCEIQADATGDVVEGNQIGVMGPSINGLYFQRGNGAEGVVVLGSSNQIGGPVADAGNLISANRSNGIRISGPVATRTIVAANYIGLPPGGGYKFGTGNPGNGDAGDGVLIEDSAQNQIGGPTSAWGNAISSNFGAGVSITGVTSTGNTILNNLIGVTADGSAAKGNAQEGVADFSPGTVIGPGNVISGNLRGVLISGPNATGVVVQGNLIGTDITGTLNLGNAEEGVLIDNASGNTVTGNANGSQVISGNNVGVAITGSSSTSQPCNGQPDRQRQVGSEPAAQRPGGRAHRLG